MKVTPVAVELLKRRLQLEQKKNELLKAKLAIPSVSSRPSSAESTQRTANGIASADSYSATIE